MRVSAIRSGWKPNAGCRRPRYSLAARLPLKHRIPGRRRAILRSSSRRPGAAEVDFVIAAGLALHEIREPDAEGEQLAAIPAGRAGAA